MFQINNDLMGLYKESAKTACKGYTPRNLVNSYAINGVVTETVQVHNNQLQYGVTNGYMTPAVLQSCLIDLSCDTSATKKVDSVDCEKRKLAMIQLSEKIYQQEGNLVDSENNLICNFLIEIREYIKSDKEEDFFEIEILSADGEQIVERLSVEKFREGNWYKKYANLMCLKPQLLKVHLEWICGQHFDKVTKSFSTAGWHEIAPGEFDYITECGDVLGKYESVRIEKDGIKVYPVKKWQERDLANVFYSMKALTKDSTAMIVMGYLILSSLYTLFKTAGYLPKGILAIIGPRSSRKTSMAMAIVKLFQRKPGMSPYLNFSSTPTSIDEALSLFKDGIMIIDDLMPNEDKVQKKKLETTLEYITRIFGDGISKKRSKKYSEEYRPEGLALLTGEYISGVSSSQSRRIVLKINELTVDCDVLSYYQDNLDIVPGFLWNFLRFCAINQKKVMKKIRDGMLLKRKKYQGRFAVDRYADYQAQLEVAMELLFDYLQSFGGVDDNTVHAELNYFSSALSRVIDGNIEEQEAKNPYQQICKTLSTMLVEDVGAFAKVDGDIKAQNYLDNEYFYIHPEWLLQAVKEYSKRQGTVSAIDNVAYMKDVLKNANALNSVKEGEKRRYTVKIPGAAKKGENRRFLKIDIKKVLIEV